MPAVGQMAERSRKVHRSDIEHFTDRVEVLEVRSDKPITKLRTSVTRDDRTVVLEGDADCYTMPLAYLQVVGPRDPLRMRTYPARGQFFRRRRQTQHLLFGAPLVGHPDGVAQPGCPDVGSGKRYEFGTKTTGRTGTYGDEWNAMTGPFTGVPAGKGGRGERI